MLSLEDRDQRLPFWIRACIHDMQPGADLIDWIEFGSTEETRHTYVPGGHGKGFVLGIHACLSAKAANTCCAVFGFESPR
jgi:hypothetical protein